MRDQTGYRLGRIDRVEQQPLVARRHLHRLAHRLVEPPVARRQHRVRDVDVARILHCAAGKAPRSSRSGLRLFWAAPAAVRHILPQQTRRHSADLPTGAVDHDRPRRGECLRSLILAFL